MNTNVTKSIGVWVILKFFMVIVFNYGAKLKKISKGGISNLKYFAQIVKTKAPMRDIIYFGIQLFFD
jgi:hypothetical protein